MSIDQVVSNKEKETWSILYRVIWRWHFYAAIVCIPFVIILSLSGAVYLFKPQIELWQEREFIEVNVSSERSNAQQQIDIAMANQADSQFLSYRLPQASNHAVQIALKKPQGKQWVYVDPYSLTIVAKVMADQQLIAWVKDLHGELLLGERGSIVVELASCWAIVLILTGLYLWWPRKQTSWAGVVYPRLNGSKRIFWRDLHSVTGIWVSFFALFLLVSGLPWTTVWGGALKELRSFQAQPVVQDWQTTRVVTPSWRMQAVSEVTLPQAVYLHAQELDFAAPALLSISDVNNNEWKFASNSQNRPLRQTVIFNANAEVLSHQQFADQSTLDRIIGVAIAAHEGQLFGWANQLLGVLTALALVFISFSGLVMWQRRKQPGKLSAPQAKRQAKIGKGVVLIIVSLAALLPLLLISILFILLFEWLLLSHVEPVKQWLGLKRG